MIEIFQRIDWLILCLISSCLFGYLCNAGIRIYLKQPGLPNTTWITVVVTAVFLIRYEYSLMAVRYILISQIWLFAGICDATTYEIPDIVHGLLFLIGLIQIQWIPALSGALLVPMPFFITAIGSNGKIGGGDVKLMMATGFAIGVTRGIGMTIWGLALGIIWNRIFQRNKSSLPLAPFLGAGGLIVMLSL